MNTTMNVTNAQYLLGIHGTNDGIKATINEVEVFVPLSPNNRHYAEIMRQVEAGDLTIADAD
jgi:hypothetical protein